MLSIVSFAFALVGLSTFVPAHPARAVFIGNVQGGTDFPAGSISFADVVVDYSPIVVVPEAFGPGIPVPVSDEEHQAILKAANDRLVEVLTKLEIKADHLIEEGDPRERIVAAAGQIEATILAIGTSGGGGLRRMLLGSVAEDVMRLAPCSVLLVRHPTSGGKE